MDYTLERCSLYDKKTIYNTPIIIFDDHNMALPVWGTFANKLKRSLKLITFDFHADTHDPFAAAVGPHDFDFKKFEREVLHNSNLDIDNFNFEDLYKLSCNYVANDEHILTAYKLDYINGYHIFCELSKDECEDYEQWDRKRGLSAFYRTRSSILNMSDDEILELCSVPFILDFDLDYFSTTTMFDEIFVQKINPLITQATVITIAREPCYFKLERTEEDFQNEEALNLLLRLIESAFDKQQHKNYQK